MAIAETTPRTNNPSQETLVGLVSAFSGFLIWGLAPLYFALLDGVGPWEIVAHRFVWTVVLLVPLVWWLGKLPVVGSDLRQPRRLAVYAAATVLMTSNWTIFIWAILNGHLLQASLGYYINPLVNVVLGVVFLREVLNPRQLSAVGLATIGVGWLVVASGQVPVIALLLALSFGFYGLIRKAASIDPQGGLLAETLIVAPIALTYLVLLGVDGQGAFGTGWGVSGLLVLAGAVTAVPLILFMHGVKRLRYATIGVMQYVAPTLQFIIAVTVFAEPFTRDHLVTFAFIWAGLALYTYDGLRRRRGG